MAFVAKDYLKNPSLETLKVLRKSDLLALGKHFDLEVKTAIRKCSILNVVIQHMVDEQLLDGMVYDHEPREIELRLKLEHELKMKQIELEVQREREKDQREIEMRTKQFKQDKGTRVDSRSE